ncbi:MAG TPA: hypothetical protein VHL52_14055 [Acidimicrobiia bacterium]|nr:hypothetical protein [Acidimicrobiia bacterium]
MPNISTSALVRSGALALAIAAIASAVAGWIGLGVIDATLTLAPEAASAAGPSENLTEVVDDTLSEVRTALVTLGSITDQVAASTDEAANVVEEVADLSTGQIPATLASLEEALPALIDTAAVIDETMRTLSFLGVDYEPQVPLDEAFQEVQSELDGLPEQINEEGERLAALVAEIRTTGTDTGLLADQITTIEASLAEAQAQIGTYGDAIDGLDRFSEVSRQLIGAIPIARIALIVLAVCGLLVGAMGWNLANRLST